MKDKIIVEMMLNQQEEDALTVFLLQRKIKHSIYTFTIGTGIPHQEVE